MNHIRIVELQHDVSGSLGLSIAGGIGSSLGDTAVMIANLTPGGAAARSQKLKVIRSEMYIYQLTVSEEWHIQCGNMEFSRNKFKYI